ncbi:MAG: Mov34/MPN/PAD-1 family protein [Syntrophothermus sp.]
MNTYIEERIMFSKWTLVFDDYLIQKIMKARESKLPNETGGILIGSYDHQRKVIYVVDSVLSPSDSIEWPNVYIRGIKGLRKKVEYIEKVTDSMLYYIGEWHSHPTECSPEPSHDDYNAFIWLSKVLNESGLKSQCL